GFPLCAFSGAWIVNRQPPDSARFSIEPGRDASLSRAYGGGPSGCLLLEGVVAVARAVSRGGLDGAGAGGVHADIRRLVRRSAGRHGAGPVDRLGSRAVRIPFQKG